MVADWIGIVLVSVGIVSLLVSGEIIQRRFGVATEYTRKLSHVGAGAIVITFPWLLHSTWTVAVLAGAFVLILAGGRITGVLRSVHGVARRTTGAYYYPFAVLGTFWLSQGRPVLYCTPIAVMALADTGAALVGRRDGLRRYQVMDGHRSLEGSLTFFGLAFAIVLTALALHGAPGWPDVLVTTLVTATLCTAAEAISVRGLDNLFIPYACFFVLERSLGLGLVDLGGWLEGMLMSLVLVVFTWNRGGLTPAGGVAAFLVGSVAWAIGGLAWTLPLLAFYALFLTTPPPDGDDPARLDLTEVFPSTAGSMVVVLAFAHTEQAALWAPFLATLAANGAIAMTRLAGMRGWPWAPLALAGAFAPLLPALLIEPDLPLQKLLVAAAVGLAAWAPLAKGNLVGRRMLASLLSGALAWYLITS